MRGEREIDCLNYVKKSFLNNLNILLYCDNKDKIRNIILNAKPNINSSQFPDFVFENGFIEHFQVTGSKETKKGAEHNKNQSYFEKKGKDQLKRLENNIKNSTPFNKLLIETTKMINSEYNYDMYQKSFKKNWENHIESLNKYDGKKDVGIFLIEYKGALLPKKQKEEVLEFYKLSEDKNLLRYMYDFKYKIHYVIFTDRQNCQVIETKLIQKLIKEVPEVISIGSGRYIRTNVNLFIDVVDIKQEFVMEKKTYE